MIKCYDSLHMDAVLGICQELGMHPRITKALWGAYSRMQRVITLNQGFGHLWTALTGAIQGCGLSNTLMNEVIYRQTIARVLSCIGNCQA